ncbi:MAG: lamin tail domain-containing protein [Phycisphaerales bacterium]
MKLAMFVRGVAAAMTCLTAAVASAQTTITQWNFNTQTLLPSTGTGTATLVGGTTVSGYFGGSPNDLGGGNVAPNVTTWPIQSAGSGTRGIEFAVSTVNRMNILVSTDMRWSTTASKYLRAQYSTNGSTFQDMPAGSSPNGSLITSPGGPTSGTNGVYITNIAYDLTGVAGVDFNPNFKVRFVTIFDPANNATYTTNQDVATYSINGAIRFDLVTVSGTATTPVSPSGVGLANPSAACRGFPITFTVNTLGGENPPSNAILVSANLSSIGGSASQSFTETATNVFTYTHIVPIGQALGAYMIPFTVTETNAMPRSTNGNFNITVNQCINDAAVVISQVYGGGGNFPDSIYRNDFVEIYNRSAAPVNIGGWSVQYAAATGGFNAKVDVPAATTLQPGQYYLVQMAAGSAGSQDLPTPDLTGSISMAAGAGKVALATNNVLLGSACIGPTVSDLVAYGTSQGSVSCYEGVIGPALGMSNTTAVFRIDNGCTDTNSNIDDFISTTPAPRTSAFPTNACGGNVISVFGFFSSAVYCPGDTFQITASVTGVAAAYYVTADLSPLGGSSAQILTDFGGGSFGFMGTVGNLADVGPFITQLTAIDGMGFSGVASVVAEVGQCQPLASQVSDPKALCTGTPGPYRLVVFPQLANANPPSSGVDTIEADFSAIGGSASVFLTDDGTGVFAGGEMVTGAFGTGTFNIPYVLTDLEARTYNGVATVEVIECAIVDGGLKISQIYGAGNNSGTPAASYDQDFIELHNTSSGDIDVTGWAVQYTSETGPNTTPNWFVVPISGTIPSGGFYLVAVNGGTTLGSPALPTPDAVSTAFGMASGGGKLAITNDQVALLTSIDCAALSVVDQASWGSAASCFEGHGPAGGHNNTRSLIRINSCQDTNNNDADFITADLTVVVPRNSASPAELCDEVVACTLDYNLDTVVNPDDLGDFITDYYTVPAIPGPGGYAIPCPENAPPYDQGYKTAFVIGGGGQCNEPFPDNLGDWITQYFGDQTCG